MIARILRADAVLAHRARRGPELLGQRAPEGRVGGPDLRLAEPAERRRFERRGRVAVHRHGRAMPRRVAERVVVRFVDPRTTTTTLARSGFCRVLGGCGVDPALGGVGPTALGGVRLELARVVADGLAARIEGNVVCQRRVVADGLCPHAPRLVERVVDGIRELRVGVHDGADRRAPRWVRGEVVHREPARRLADEADEGLVDVLARDEMR
mmetsp:Transcript_3307/g.12735  ORF Transcript_3307/g.12735 Transcript_3307/m.12735 type:complete len:211 (+) Transcript_3307:584-1216(+)